MREIKEKFAGNTKFENLGLSAVNSNRKNLKALTDIFQNLVISEEFIDEELMVSEKRFMKSREVKELMLWVTDLLPQYKSDLINMIESLDGSAKSLIRCYETISGWLNIAVKYEEKKGFVHNPFKEKLQGFLLGE